MVKKLGFNKKYYNFLIIVGIIIIVSLLLVFILIKPKANKKTSNRLFQNRELFTGIPSDAVMVFYFDCLSNYESILKDTNSFAYGLFEKNNPLVKLQKDLTSYNQIENIPFVYSLHYSSKNNVSFLQILDFSDSKEKNDIFNKTKNAPNVKWKDYNNERIYTYSNGLNICFKEN